MKTVLFEKINGYDIIKGFDNATIDPEETKKVVIPMLDESDEMIAYKKAVDEIHACNLEARANAKKAYNFKLKNEISAAQEMAIKFSDLKTKAEFLQNELKKHKEPIEKKYSELFAANAIYCIPSGNEKIITDEEYENYITTKIPKKSALCLDGKTVDLKELGIGLNVIDKLVNYFKGK
jgi:hypothetical protein